mmetsp:Transcript_531/g.1826  ORF Transcript_531/g.1826 Transcript_531/m.1826 type:complete len:244 (-) Transcript_531:141-872(-)
MLPLGAARARFAAALAASPLPTVTRSRWPCRVLQLRTFAGPAAPDMEVKFPKVSGPITHLPLWAQREERPPLLLRSLGVALLLPLGAGALAVHLLAGNPLEGDDESEYSRTVLSWSIHYASALLAFAGAAHWGMQLAELGVPRKSDYMALYYLSRFSAPVVFVMFGWLGSVLSTAEPREASLWLMSGWVGLGSCDFLASAFRITPHWWFRWRAGFSFAAFFAVLVLMLSERNLYLGQKPMIRM